MQRLLCTFLFLIPWDISAQGGRDTLLFRDTSNYTIAIEHYLGQIGAGHAGYGNYYQAACYFALRNTPEMAFQYLKEAIERGARGEDVHTDTDFDSLRQHFNEWKEIEELIKAQYLERYPEILNPDLGYELWLMGIEDQRFRTLKRNYKLTVQPATNTERHVKDLERVKAVVNASGWPKHSEVGIEGGDAVFYIFQHDQAGNMKKVLPGFIAAAKAGEGSLPKAAMMIDRYLAYTEHVQLYGSQAFRKIEQGHNSMDSQLNLYPIADEENLMARRASIGMVDFLDNCERLGVGYVPIQMRPTYKPLAIRKRWIKAGYLL